MAAASADRGSTFTHNTQAGSGATDTNVDSAWLSPELKAEVGDEVKPLVVAPEVDYNHPLASYWISSSHNTYLHKHQLYGKSSEKNYSDILGRGGRCVEIDAWDGDDDDEDKVVVYHGYTAVDKLGFRNVCEAIANTVGPNDPPVIVALENHTNLENQKYIIKTIKEVFGEKLVSEIIQGTKFKDQLTPSEGRGRILIATEYSKPPGEEPINTDPNSARDVAASEESSSSDESDDEEAQAARRKRKETKVSVLPELVNLGPYSSSIKPPKLKDDRLPFWERPLFQPGHHVVNASESFLSKIMPTHLQSVLMHTHEHLYRVYPKGLRISSKNLDPSPFWRIGAQICALNWQTFDKGMQLNEALFSGTKGWVLKPARLRGSDDPDSENAPKHEGNVKLDLKIVGASGLPLPEDVGDGNLKPYVRVEVLASRTHHDSTSVYKIESNDKESRGKDPIWNHQMSFTFADEELVFVRFLVYHKDSFYSRDDISAIFTARLDNIQTGGPRAARLLSVAGEATQAALLVEACLEHV